MIAFEVKDMTCGHCVSTITKAVKAADKDAKVRIDLASHRVEIEPAESDFAELGDAIREAGYTPVAIEAPAKAQAAAAPAAKGGCSCG
jgi:copper chaperone